MNVDFTETDPVIEEFDVNCSKCEKGYNWEDVNGKFQPVEKIEQLIENLKILGLPDGFLKIERAFQVKCPCGTPIIIAEILEACEPDEDGYSAPAYLALSFGKSGEESDGDMP